MTNYNRDANNHVGKSQIIRALFLTALCLFWIFSKNAVASQDLLQQDPDTVSGTITDLYYNTPLSGVTVMVVGTSTMVRSEEDGTYRIELPENAEALLFSYTGYQPLKIEIGDRREIQITMSPLTSPQESELWDM